MRILVNDLLIFSLMVLHNIVMLIAWFRVDSVTLFSIQSLLFCGYILFAYAVILDNYDKRVGNK